MLTQSGSSQADTREFVVYTDQHGREWEGWGDVKAKLHPTTALKPVFQAPWIPDQRHMTFSQRKPGEFTINYDGMIAALELAHQARRDHVLRVADHFNVPNFDPDTDTPTAQMKRELGQGPLPVDPILAARAGNGYVLGKRPFDPSKPSDVKLQAAIALWNQQPKPATRGQEYADTDFADAPSEASAELVPVAPKKKMGRPTNAERAARVTEEQWANAKE